MLLMEHLGSIKKSYFYFKRVTKMRCIKEFDKGLYKKSIELIEIVVDYLEMTCLEKRGKIKDLHEVVWCQNPGTDRRKKW